MSRRPVASGGCRTGVVRICLLATAIVIDGRILKRRQTFLGISGLLDGALRGLARLSSISERVADKSIAEFFLRVFQILMHRKMMVTLAVKFDPLLTIHTRGVLVPLKTKAIKTFLQDVADGTFQISMIRGFFGVNVCQFMTRYAS